jgi:hypothetical protein
MPHLWFWLSAFFLIFAASTISLAPQTGPYVYLRCLSAFIIILFLPGFAFIQMLFSDGGSLDHVGKVALSVGVSLALTPLATLVLNYTPYGINRDSVLASLALLTVLFAVCAYARGRRLRINLDGFPSRAVGQAGLSLIEVSLLALPLALAVFLRTYPSLVSGLPFSVDAWPSIKYAEVLLERSPVSLGDEMLRGCDELGDRLSGAAISALTGLQPLTAMSFFLPVAGAMSILILYALVREILNGKAAFLASMLLSTAFTDVILTAGVKGETYAHPLYMLLIFLYLHKSMALWKRTLLFSLAGASIVLTHYYTAILTAAMLASMGAATLISKWKKSARLEGLSLLFPSILALMVLAYLAVYANWAFSFMSTIDWLSAASFQLVFFASMLYLAFKPHSTSRGKSIILCVAALSAALTLAFLATRRPLVSGAPVLPLHYLLYAGPFVAAAPLAILGYRAYKSLNNEHAILPLFWLAVVLGLEGYAVFGNVEPGLGLTLAYRGVNFLLPPLFILCAAGFLGLLEGKAKSLRRFTKVSAVTVLMVILTLNLFTFYAAIFVQERYIGYFWLYRLPEYRAGLWVSSACSDEIVTGDVKFAYLLKCYFGLEVDEFQGLLYLSGKSSSKPEILLTYDQMTRNGYVVYGGYSVDMPENWMERSGNLSLVYSNGIADVHAGG